MITDTNTAPIKAVHDNPDRGAATAVITGAAGVMGMATVQVLCSRGWHVLCIDHNSERLAILQKKFGSKCSVLCCDVQSKAFLEEVQIKLEDVPGVGALVNMVGVSKGGDLFKMQNHEWDLSFAINVTPAMRLTQLVAPMMQVRRGGSIVNVGSPVGVLGARKPQYAASKAALHGLTMSAARALGSYGVRVNLLLPGPTITGMTHDWSEQQREEVANGTFLKRLCRPEEVAQVVAFLIGDESQYITASVIDMTAGSMLGH